MKLNVYLTFNGTCAEAFPFYEKILGGQNMMMMKYEGSPGEEHVSADWKDKVMHASMEVGGMMLMGSDSPPNYFKTPQGYHVSINLTDEAEADRIFAALSDGAEITMPMEKTFWARRFGMLTDKYGINWQVNCE